MEAYNKKKEEVTMKKGLKIKIDPLKAMGIGATLLGLVASLFSGVVEEKKTDAKIKDKVDKAVTEAMMKVK